MKKILIIAFAVMAMVSCTSEKKQDADETKVLVLYYSQTNATKAVAEEIQRWMNADIESIDVTMPYDGDFQQTIERCQKEMADGTVPELVPLKSDLTNYDLIFIGYPVWFGTYAPPVAALLKAVDLSGKTIVPFCTFGSGGLNTSTDDLKKALPDADIRAGYGVRNARLAAMPEEVEHFLKAYEYVDGEVEHLIDYAEEQPVTEEETAIFEAACGNYPMLHATPVTVGRRGTSKGVDYLYTAEENGKMLKVKVTVSNEEGAVPEFTEVIR